MREKVITKVVIKFSCTNIIYLIINTPFDKEMKFIYS